MRWDGVVGLVSLEWCEVMVDWAFTSRHICYFMATRYLFSNRMEK